MSPTYCFVGVAVFFTKWGVYELSVWMCTFYLQILHNKLIFHPEWSEYYHILSTKILPPQQKMLVGGGAQSEQNISDEVKTHAGL